MFTGIDVATAPVLAQSLRSWDHQLDDVVALIRQAETLSDVLTGVHGLLDAIGADGREMARAVDRAVDEILGFEIDLSTFSPRLQLPQPGGLWSQAGSDKLTKVPLFQEQGKDSDRSQASSAFPVDASQIAGAQDEIEQAFIAGRDRAPAIERYRELLGRAIGDTSPQAAAAAMSFMSQGVPVHEIGPELVHGTNALLGRVATAMAQGDAPATANLHPGFFPTGYVDWHEHQGLETQYRVAGWALERGNNGDDTRLRESLVQDYLQAVVDELPASEPWPEREWLQTMLDGGDVSAGQTERVKALVGSFAQSRLDELGPRPAAMVETLHGQAQVDHLGRVTPFEAIGAAASTLSPPLATYVGDSYAQFHWAFDASEVGQAASYLAGDQDTAVGFFASLGPDGAARLLQDFRFESGPLGHGPISSDISNAFGLASNDLPADFGADVVRAGHQMAYEMTLSPLRPEDLFATGTFAPDFLSSAAVASVTGQARAPRYGSTVDPRMVVLATVARQELGAELAHALVDNASLDAFVWSQAPFDETGMYNAGESDMPVVSQLLLQAAQDAPISAALISMGGAWQGELDVDIAHGLSYVIAANLPYYELAHTHAAPDEQLIHAADNVFAAGAGIDIELAAERLVEQELAAGFASGDQDWWLDLTWAPMTGHLEATKLMAHTRVARTYDESVRSANEWYSLISTEGGLVLGAGSLVTGGAVSVAFGIAGLGATSLGFFQIDDPSKVHQVTRDGFEDLLVQSQVTEESTLRLALELGVVDMPAGTTLVRWDLDSDHPTLQAVDVERRSATTFVASTDEHAGSWSTQAMAWLDDMGATIFDGNHHETVASAVGTVAWVGVTGSRITAMNATPGILRRDQDEEDDDE